MSVEWLRGRTCTRVYEHYPQNFTFEFGEGSLAVDSLWRIIEEGRVFLTSRNHALKFGLPEPVDAYGKAFSKLVGRTVVGVRLIESSADLFVDFEGGQRLEVLTDTSGYEAWNLTAPGVHVVACCGGGIANFGG